MVTKVEVEVEVKSSADQFWAAILDSANLFPKISPNLYKSIEILEGDGKSAGSIRLITFAEGIQCLKFEKMKIDVVDHEKKLVTYSVIGGEILSYYKSFVPTLAVASKGDGGAVVTWSVEYEKLNEDAPDAETIKEFAVQTFQGLDAYLLKN
ncbi:MLP-like protein 423 [Platanthera guangdongensis]|uniref:MLP-like protein 423 n=1 Tax=Platanthera guangdongensis TaxID=2320717 RepID=A0ABR2M5H4_9ASPA